LTKKLDPDIEARKNAPKGTIVELEQGKFDPRSTFGDPLAGLAIDVKDVKNGGGITQERKKVMILSGTNRETLNYGLWLLGAHHLPSQVLGRHVGQRLISFWDHYIVRLLMKAREGMDSGFEERDGGREALERSVKVDVLLEYMQYWRFRLDSLLDGMAMKEAYLYNKKKRTDVQQPNEGDHKSEGKKLDGNLELDEVAAEIKHEEMVERGNPLYLYAREIQILLDRFDSIMSIAMYESNTSTAWDVRCKLQDIDEYFENFNEVRTQPNDSTNSITSAETTENATFSTNPAGGSDHFADIMISTIHKARGLERDHVYFLHHSKKDVLRIAKDYRTNGEGGDINGKTPKTPWSATAYRNLVYIVCTRPKKTLGFIKSPANNPKKNTSHVSQVPTFLGFFGRQLPYDVLMERWDIGPYDPDSKLTAEDVLGENITDVRIFLEKAKLERVGCGIH
jgi:hypothetical protein